MARRKEVRSTATLVAPRTSPVVVEAAFAEVLGLIEQARQRVDRAANTELVDLYWRIGELISRRVASDGWGKGTVVALSAFIQRSQPGIRGFSPPNLWRMRQVYDAYVALPELATLLREVPWSASLHILAMSKLREEREFYLRMAVRNRWTVREVARQINASLFERSVLHPVRTSKALAAAHPQAANYFKDAYRDVRKGDERPSIGLLLCASKDAQVVEYALSRSVSPALIAIYQALLPDKAVLQAKLSDLYQQIAVDALPAPSGGSRKPTKKKR